MRLRPDRRSFLKSAAILGAGVWCGGTRARRRRSANDRLDVAVIGAGNRGWADLEAVSGENIVALCDVDETFLARAGERHPKAARFRDFRKLLDDAKCDAVVVATPDHTHACATLRALAAGRHVYCEKPLAWSVQEARDVAALAAKSGLTTQLGTQVHSGAPYRRVVEKIRAGAIGEIREAHVWVGRAWAGGEAPSGDHAVPKPLDFDLWLGPAAARPYRPGWHPVGWRGFWDFGGGTLSDMACHHLDLPVWALDLGHPETVEAEGPPVHAAFAPPSLIVRYAFPARGDRPPVQLTWHHGPKRPPACSDPAFPKWGDGTLFVGSKGMLLADYHGFRLLPEGDFEQDPAPRDMSVADTNLHQVEWLEAIRAGRKASCDFAYGGRLTEIALLGNVAYRAGGKLRWDGAAGEAKDCPPAQALLARADPRPGWFP